MPMIEFPLTLLGVGYMLYLAFKILTSKENTSDKEEENKRNLFIVGVFLQFVNPKGILFGITVVATYILPMSETSFFFIFRNDRYFEYIQLGAIWFSFSKDFTSVSSIV